MNRSVRDLSPLEIVLVFIVVVAVSLALWGLLVQRGAENNRSADEVQSEEELSPPVQRARDLETEVNTREVEEALNN